MFKEPFKLDFAARDRLLNISYFLFGYLLIMETHTKNLPNVPFINYLGKVLLIDMLACLLPVAYLSTNILRKMPWINKIDV